MTALIEAEGLAKSFGTLRAVDGITLNVARGEVLGFLGPNGAGKSTTMRLITGFLEPDAGRARIAGFDVQDQPKEARKRLGYLPEGAPLYAEMTPKGLLAFRRRAQGVAGRCARQGGGRWRSRGPVLVRCSSRPSRRCPRATSAASASPRRSCNDPEVLIMDEPTDGLDPNQKHQVRQLITEMAKEKAIIVSTHILEEVEAVCTRAVVINRGRIVADGTAEDLMRRVPYHGAVAMRVAADKAEALKDALAAVAGVGSVETVSSADGQLLLRAIPKNGAGIVTDVASAIRQKALVVEEIFVERGKLDDVFRQITSSDLDKTQCVRSLQQHLDRRQARVRGLFRHADRHRLPHHLRGADRRLRLLRRRLLRARPGGPVHLLHLSPVALSAAGAGHRHAAVGGGAQDRHHRAADDAADLAVGGHPRQVRSPPGPSSAWR